MTENPSPLHKNGPKRGPIAKNPSSSSKTALLWMNVMNSDGCHNKASGASAYKKATGSL